MGEGDSEPEARQFLDEISMNRTGSLVSLNASHSGGPVERRPEQSACTCPKDAPLTIYAVGAVELRDMSGPVRIAAVGGRATILNTTGTVNARRDRRFRRRARACDAHLLLGDRFEINWPRFLGNLSAYAQREVRVLVPHGFESSIEVMVDSKKDFVCRADLCSGMKEERVGGAYVFRNMPAAKRLRWTISGSDPIIRQSLLTTGARSVHSTVTFLQLSLLQNCLQNMEKRQGTTSVVLNRAKYDSGFSRCEIVNN